MPGATFTPGQAQVRPGVYVTVQNVGSPPPPQTGVVAAIFAATWGPLGQVVTLNDYPSVTTTFGTGGNVECPKEVFLGGAQQVLAYRLTGSGGAAASCTLKDTTTPTPVNIVTLTAKY